MKSIFYKTVLIVLIAGSVVENSQSYQSNLISLTKRSSNVNFGNCSDYIVGWNDWIGGFQARFKVHGGLKGISSGWNLVFIMDNDVSNLNIYDAIVNENHGKVFSVSNTTWNGEIRSGTSKTFGFFGTFNKDLETSPKIAYILFLTNNKLINCADNSKNNEKTEKYKDKATSTKSPQSSTDDFTTEIQTETNALLESTGNNRVKSTSKKSTPGATDKFTTEFQTKTSILPESTENNEIESTFNRSTQRLSDEFTTEIQSKASILPESTEINEVESTTMKSTRGLINEFTTEIQSKASTLSESTENNEVESTSRSTSSQDSTNEFTTEIQLKTSTLPESTENNEVKISNTVPAQNLTGRGIYVAWPKKILGLYILLADDSEKGFESDSDNWTPKLYEWQQKYANVLFFTFIHPETMDVPPAFAKLAATRNNCRQKNNDGCVGANTVIIFAIGGYSYSIKPNPWKWLTSRSKAEAMAEIVALWPKKYGIDGIDLDLEEGAGSRAEAGRNMIFFIKRLRELVPNIIISQPTYGYPQVAAEIDVINASWDPRGKSNNLADSVGLMVYEGTESLRYVKNYAIIKGKKRWEGFPITANVSTSSILLGAKGLTSKNNLISLANAAIKQDLLGIMVWYSSVINGFQYASSWDATNASDSISGYRTVANIFNIVNDL